MVFASSTLTVVLCLLRQVKSSLKSIMKSWRRRNSFQVWWITCPPGQLYLWYGSSSCNFYCNFDFLFCIIISDILIWISLHSFVHVENNADVHVDKGARSTVAIVQLSSYNDHSSYCFYIFSALNAFILIQQRCTSARFSDSLNKIRI